VPEHGHVDRLCIDTIGRLASDAVQAANSGHPRAPLPLAPAAYVLGARVVQHNPADPAWPDRDRGIDGFGDSGPGRELLTHFGIPPAALAESAQL
jgi:transketolase